MDIAPDSGADGGGTVDMKIMPSCDTCRHYLGGWSCRINLEAECAAGEFEAWEPREQKDGDGHADGH